MCFREGDELRDRRRRKRGMNGEDVGITGDQADRCKIALGIVVKLPVERGAHCERRDIAAEDRVPVRHRAGRYFGADGVAHPGAIVDDDLYAEPFGQRGADGARDDVTCAARRGAGDVA